MEFIAYVLKQLMENRETKSLIDIASEAFKYTLSNHLDWFARNEAQTLITTLPATLTQFFQSYVL